MAQTFGLTPASIAALVTMLQSAIGQDESLMFCSELLDRKLHFRVARIRPASNSISPLGSSRLALQGRSAIIQRSPRAFTRHGRGVTPA